MRPDREVDPRDEAGQSTLEYVLVLAALMALVLGLGAIWHAGSGGALWDLQRPALSHSLEGGLVGALKDVLLY